MANTNRVTYSTWMRVDCSIEPYPVTYLLNDGDVRQVGRGCKAMKAFVMPPPPPHTHTHFLLLYHGPSAVVNTVIFFATCIQWYGTPILWGRRTNSLGVYDIELTL